MRAIVLAFLILNCWLPLARPAEQTTFYGKTVDGWLAVLRSEKSSVEAHRQAIWAVGCFGAEAKGAAPELIAAAGHKDLETTAVAALVGIRAGHDVTIPRLVEQLRKRGCEHLTGTGSFFFDPSIDDNLVRIGRPAVPALVKILNGPKWEMRMCAAHILSRIGAGAADAVPALVRAIEQPDLKDQQATVSLYAVRALGRIGPKAKEAVPAIEKLVATQKIDEFDATMALGRIGVPPVSRLVDNLIHNADSYAADQLAWLGPRARKAGPALQAALTDKRLQVRFSAAIALTSTDPTAAVAVPVLIESLKYWNNQEIDAFDSPRALGRLGPLAIPALPVLVKLIDEDCDDSVLKALVQIDPEGHECVPALISALRSEDYVFAAVAADCLGLLGPRAKVAVPALTTAVTRNFREDFFNGVDPNVSAARALRRIGTPALSAIPQLIVALKFRRTVSFFEDDAKNGKVEKNCDAAAAVAELLGSFGPRAKAAVPYLTVVVQNHEGGDDWSLRAAAALALGRIGEDAKAAIPVLREIANNAITKRASLRESLVALYQLDPSALNLVEKWLAKPVKEPIYAWPALKTLEWRAMVLGTIGRRTVEGDYLVRHFLEGIDWTMNDHDPRDRDLNDYLEWQFDRLGRLGSAARLAVPRLVEFGKDPSPRLRMFAAEAIEEITAPSRTARPE